MSDSPAREPDATPIRVTALRSQVPAGVARHRRRAGAAHVARRRPPGMASSQVAYEVEAIARRPSFDAC